VEHGVLVPFQVEDGGRTTELYVLDTGANRRALARIRAGESAPPAPTPAPAPERQAARPDLFSLYEANIGAIFPMAAERLKALEEDHPAAWIEDAFREAVRQNRRSLAYIEAILRRWRDEGRGDGEAGRRPGKVTASDIVRRARR
jgi:DnaD/phage-associated family protein